MSLSAKRIARTYTPRALRNWLRSPARSVEWVWNEAQHLAGANRRIEMRPGWRLRSHPSAYRFAYFAQDDDPAQVAEFNAFIATCRPGMSLFDIGAHFGLFSLAALHYGGDDARAVAVDPSPTAARMLKIQSRLNRMSDRLTIVQAAVGESTGAQRMVATGVNGAGYLVAPGDHPASELTETRTTTLDQLVEDFNLTPTHLKIDVEGYEAAVLRGGRNTLTQANAPVLFLELHHRIISEQGGDPAETLDHLREFGYAVHSLNGATLSDELILAEPLIRIVAMKTCHTHFTKALGRGTVA
ncbi:MAG: FkbM family methyltransferase [Pyrinomonadaceae bacterium]